MLFASKYTDFQNHDIFQEFDREKMKKKKKNSPAILCSTILAET